METINIAICGDNFVGKTSLIESFLKNTFKDNSSSIIENDKHSILYNYKKLFNLNIYDTVGSSFNCFDTLKKCDAFIILFSLENKVSFENISMYIDIISCLFNKMDVPILIVGNKNDLDKDKLITISKKEIQRYNVPIIFSNNKDSKSSIKVINNLINQTIKKEIQMKKELNLSRKIKINNNNNNNNQINNFFNKFKCFNKLNFN